MPQPITREQVVETGIQIPPGQLLLMVIQQIQELIRKLVILHTSETDTQFILMLQLLCQELQLAREAQEY